MRLEDSERYPTRCCKLDIRSLARKASCGFRISFISLFSLHVMLLILFKAIISIFHFFTVDYFLQRADQYITSRDMKTIIILGGSYAGITLGHDILKQSKKTRPLKVIMVSPNTHHYGNMASARAIVPGQFADEALFKDIAGGFSQYRSNRFEFVVGWAEMLDLKSRKVRISRENDQVWLSYDFLVLSTGTRTKERTPLKGLGATEATKAALHDFRGKVEKAASIVVAGAGITGVEVAGELGYAYGTSKKITLVRICSFTR